MQNEFRIKSTLANIVFKVLKLNNISKIYIAHIICKLSKNIFKIITKWVKV